MNVQIKFINRQLSEYLWRAGQTVSTAESCTAGAVASALASLPGASNYFRGGIVAYAEDLKTALLSVDEQLLQEKGAVSEDVAKAMAEGAIEHLKSDYAISVTGYAGPGGGAEAPVGTIWIAVGKAGDIETRQLTGDDGREPNVQRATLTALVMLLERMQRDFPLETES
ncbi:MAG: CinA family protein [Bacteroidota bacterium]|nr:CinA family protein [Bacteroidota bacterium]